MIEAFALVEPRFLPPLDEDFRPAALANRAFRKRVRLSLYDGCRIEFDLGASDRKVSAVINGEAVYSEEVVWEPRIQPIKCSSRNFRSLLLR